MLGDKNNTYRIMGIMSGKPKKKENEGSGTWVATTDKKGISRGEIS